MRKARNKMKVREREKEKKERERERSPLGGHFHLGWVWW
jgi:hypothetical protein